MRPAKSHILTYIFLLAALLGLAAASFVYQGVVWKDDALYAIIARRIASGHGFSDPVPYLLAAPLFPVLTGFVSRFTFGDVLITGRLISCLLWFLTGVLLFRYMARTNTHRISVLGTLLWACVTFPLAASMLTEPMYTFLLFSSFLAAQSVLETGSRPAAWLLFGFFGSLAYLTRPEGIWFFGVALGTILFILLKRGTDRGRLFLFAAGSLAVYMAVASPYVIHVHEMTGKWKISGKQTGHFGRHIKNAMNLPSPGKGFANYHLVEFPENGPPGGTAQTAGDPFPGWRALKKTSWGGIKILGHLLRNFGLVGFGLFFLYVFTLPRQIRGRPVIEKPLLLIELAFLSTLIPVACLLPKFRIVLPYLTLVGIFCVRGLSQVKADRWKKILGVLLVLQCLYGAADGIGDLKEKSTRYTENRTMGLWIQSHLPDLAKTRMLSTFAGVPYYARTDYYTLVYLESLGELTDFMERFSFKYLLLEPEEIRQKYPPYSELLEPGGDHGRLELLHREKGNQDLFLFELGGFKGPP